MNKQMAEDLTNQFFNAEKLSTDFGDAIEKNKSTAFEICVAALVVDKMMANQEEHWEAIKKTAKEVWDKMGTEGLI